MPIPDEEFFVSESEARVIRERDRYRAALETLLALRSSVERDRGNDVPLVGNLQAREVIERALRDA